MTERAESNPKSPIEEATENTINILNAIISHSHARFKITVPEKEFRRILAGYFEGKSYAEWCETLQTDPQIEKAERQT